MTLKRFVVMENDEIRNDYDTEEEAIQRCEELFARYCEEKRLGCLWADEIPKLSYYEWKGTKN